QQCRRTRQGSITELFKAASYMLCGLNSLVACLDFKDRPQNRSDELVGQVSPIRQGFCFDDLPAVRPESAGKFPCDPRLPGARVAHDCHPCAATLPNGSSVVGQFRQLSIPCNKRAQTSSDGFAETRSTVAHAGQDEDMLLADKSSQRARPDR